MSTMLSRITKGPQAAPLRELVYGVEGVGKSTFVANAPAPIFLWNEDGTLRLHVDRLPRPETWADVLQQLEELATAEHGYKTICVDTLDSLEPLCWRAVCENQTRFANSIEDYGYGKGYTFAVEEWRKFKAGLERLEARGMNVLLVAHAHVKKVANPLGEDWDQFTLKLQEKASALFREWVHSILFVNYDVQVKVDKLTKRAKGVGTPARYIYTKRRAGFVAKTRYSLPDRMALNWDDFAAGAAKGIPVAPILAAVIEGITRLKGAPYEARAKAYLAKAGGDVALLEQLDAWISAKLELEPGDGPSAAPAGPPPAPTRTSSATGLAPATSPIPAPIPAPAPSPAVGPVAAFSSAPGAVPVARSVAEELGADLPDFPATVPTAAAVGKTPVPVQPGAEPASLVEAPKSATGSVPESGAVSEAKTGAPAGGSKSAGAVGGDKAPEAPAPTSTKIAEPSGEGAESGIPRTPSVDPRKAEGLAPRAGDVSASPPKLPSEDPPRPVGTRCCCCCNEGDPVHPAPGFHPDACANETPGPTCNGTEKHAVCEACAPGVFKQLWEHLGKAPPAATTSPPVAAPVGDPGECRSIFWRLTASGKKSPYDADGTSHFATCPSAASHRKPREGGGGVPEPTPPFGTSAVTVTALRGWDLPMLATAPGGTELTTDAEESLLEAAAKMLRGDFKGARDLWARARTVCPVLAEAITRFAANVNAIAGPKDAALTLEEVLARLGEKHRMDVAELLEGGASESAGPLCSTILASASRGDSHGVELVNAKWHAVGGELTGGAKPRRKPLTFGQLRCLVAELPARFGPPTADGAKVTAELAASIPAHPTGGTL